MLLRPGCHRPFLADAVEHDVDPLVEEGGQPGDIAGVARAYRHLASNAGQLVAPGVPPGRTTGSARTRSTSRTSGSPPFDVVETAIASPECGDTTYTIVSGEISIVTHAGTSASGNTNFTITITPRTVKLQDQAGNAYTLRGAIWFGTTSNAATGGSQATSTDKFQIVSQGAGTVDSINAVAQVSPNGKEFAFSFGTCEG